MCIYIYISPCIYAGDPCLRNANSLSRKGGVGFGITAYGSCSIQSIYELLGMAMRRLTQEVRRVRRPGTHSIRGLGFRAGEPQKVLGFWNFTSSHKKDSAGLLGVWERKVILLLYRIQK